MMCATSCIEDRWGIAKHSVERVRFFTLLRKTHDTLIVLSHRAFAPLLLLSIATFDKCIFNVRNFWLVTVLR